MKKAFLFLAVAMICGVCFAGEWYGIGKMVTASNTAQSVSVANVDGKSFPETVSVYNSGTNVLNVAVNITVANFDAEVSAGRVIRIPAGMTFTFNRSRVPDQFFNVCVSTASGTTLVYVAAY